MPGRLYRAFVQLVYLSGTLPDDERDALHTALVAEVPELSLTVAHEPHDVVRVSATVPAPSPLAAMSTLSAALDRALMHTGLFERFDATGRVLRVAPLELSTAADAS